MINSPSNMIRAIEQAQASNLKIDGESMYHRLYAKDAGKNLTVVSRVSARITLTYLPHNYESRDIFIYPYSAIDYNPMSPFAVY